MATTNGSNNTKWMVNVTALIAFLGCVAMPIFSNIQRNSWLQVSSLPQETVKVAITPLAECGTYRFRLPPMPNGVVAAYQVCRFYGDGANFDAYIVLNDNSVWKWHTQRVMLEGLVEPLSRVSEMFGGAVLGALAGCILVLLISALKWVKRKLVNNTTQDAS